MKPKHWITLGGIFSVAIVIATFIAVFPPFSIEKKYIGETKFIWRVNNWTGNRKLISPNSSDSGDKNRSLSADSIELFDAELRHSGGSFYYRLRNKSQYSLRSVSIRVIIYKNGRQIDTDTIYRDSLLPEPGLTKSCRESIYVRLPDGSWNWDYKVTEVKATKD